MKLIVKDLYLDEVLNKYKELFKCGVAFDDDTGIYKLPLVNLKIKAWNRHVEVLNKTGFNPDTRIANLFKFMTSCEGFWFEYDEEE